MQGEAQGESHSGLQTGREERAERGPQRQMRWGDCAGKVGQLRGSQERPAGWEEWEEALQAAGQEGGWRLGGTAWVSVWGRWAVMWAGDWSGVSGSSCPGKLSGSEGQTGHGRMALEVEKGQSDPRGRCVPLGLGSSEGDEGKTGVRSYMPCKGWQGVGMGSGVQFCPWQGLVERCQRGSWVYECGDQKCRSGLGVTKGGAKEKGRRNKSKLQLSLEKASVQKQRQGRRAAESLVGDQPHSGLQTRALGLARQTRDWMSPLHSPISALHPIKPTMPS